MSAVAAIDETAESLALYPYMSMRPAPRGRTPIVTIATFGISLLHVHTEGKDILYREDINAFGLDACDAYLAARLQLAALVEAGKIVRRADRGPWDVPSLVFEHKCLAASCMVLPGLFEYATQALESDRLIIAAPRRSMMVVLPDLGEAFRAAVRDSLRGDNGEECPLFALEPSGPSVLHEKIPTLRRRHSDSSSAVVTSASKIAPSEAEAAPALARSGSRPIVETEQPSHADTQRLAPYEEKTAENDITAMRAKRSSGTQPLAIGHLIASGLASGMY